MGEMEQCRGGRATAPRVLIAMARELTAYPDKVDDI